MTTCAVTFQALLCVHLVVTWSSEWALLQTKYTKDHNKIIHVYKLQQQLQDSDTQFKGTMGSCWEGTTDSCAYIPSMRFSCDFPLFSISIPLLLSPSNCCLTDARLLPRAASCVSWRAFSSVNSCRDSTLEDYKRKREREREVQIERDTREEMWGERREREEGNNGKEKTQRSV